MNPCYEDILGMGRLLGKEPLWFDRHAVPRYTEFHPRQSSCIYASQVMLMLIQCQNCRTAFKVEMTFSSFDAVLYNAPPLSERVREKAVHYGDPPNTWCCPSGPSMNCIDVRVEQFWIKNADYEWEREPSLEIEIEGEWDDD